MADQAIDVLLLSVGHDLPYLTGYYAMPLERLTMLVVPRDGDATLVVPELEARRVVEQPDVFTIEPWPESADPVDDRRPPVRRGVDARCRRPDVGALPRRVAAAPAGGVIPTSRRRHRPAARWSRTTPRSPRCGPPAPLPIASPAQLHAGEIALVGRTEAQVSADISARLLAEGHDKVNFAIVAAGANAASPHHHASGRVIDAGEIVLCDFGGTMDGYCSDITRCVFTGDPPAEIAEAYAVLHAAQAASVAAATVGTSCEDVDRAARQIIADAGYGEYFIHRTGHGIGIEEHEDPYIIAGNTQPLAPGHAFSVEPGIYLGGRWGMRLEDIVVASDAGPQRLNNADHSLVTV